MRLVGVVGVPLELGLELIETYWTPMKEMFATGKPPYPVERTLCVSGILESCLDSKAQGHRRLETPLLDVTYRAPAQSQFCRA